MCMKVCLHVYICGIMKHESENNCVLLLFGLKAVEKKVL